MQRREFLQKLGIGLTTPWVVQACGPASQGGGSSSGGSTGTPDAGDPDEAFFEVTPGADPTAVFSLGVASGDPTPSGFILWTRVKPEAVMAGVKLAFEVATDGLFATVVTRGLVASGDLTADHDFCIKVDTDTRLQPGTRYFYRFIYNGTASRTGRARTLPAADAAVESVKLAVVTCQDYTNGYYGAFHLIAQQELDFVVHLGDFIYESAGDPALGPLLYEDRAVVLPSGGEVAMDLADYRAIYRTYRSDARLQRAMEAHTFIQTWDDHECANVCYWDAENNRLGAPDHPYAEQPELLNGLKLQSQQAWWEYVPARVTFVADTQDPHAALSIYRSFRFGTLAHLCMTDERTYRSAPPCGTGGLGERYVAACEASNDPGQSMLGQTQRQWLVQEFSSSNALWKVWGNEVLLSPFTVPKFGAGGLERDAAGNFIRVALSMDGWDGYAAERRAILGDLKSAGVENVLAITGDLHTTIIAKAKIDPNGPDSASNIGALEFMTPAVTSANIKQIVRDQSGFTLNALALGVVRMMNPHFHFLDGDKWGFSTLELTRESATFRVYDVDKDTDEDPDTLRTLTAATVNAGTTTFRAP